MKAKFILHALEDNFINNVCLLTLYDPTTPPHFSSPLGQPRRRWVCRIGRVANACLSVRVYYNIIMIIAIAAVYFQSEFGIELTSTRFIKCFIGLQPHRPLLPPSSSMGILMYNAGRHIISLIDSPLHTQSNNKNPPNNIRNLSSNSVTVWRRQTRRHEFSVELIITNFAIHLI